ncbi:MAG: peptide deformylase [Alphaproteobacteria bacterium]|nr:peptide deformylase [Alphaproteobacteria bacterium]
MALHSVIIAPDKRLKATSKPVDSVDAGIRRLMDDMLETMYAAPGIGLAAIQVGVPLRVIVADLSREGEPTEPLRLVNPEVLWRSPELVTYEEGCLSLPEHYAEVERPARARIRYTDHDGRMIELEADGLLATCLQHEIDHLTGVLFVDHLSALRRGIILRKLAKARKATIKASV